MTRSSSKGAGRLIAILAKMLLILMGFQLVALAAVAAAELVPDRLIVEELREGYETGVLTQSLVMSQRTGGLTDHYGECVLLTIGLGDHPEDNLFERAALSNNLHQCVVTYQLLEADLAGDQILGSYKIRYWNGLSVIARPTVAIVGVSGLRTIAVVALVISLVAFSVFLRDTLGPVSVLGFLAALATADLLGLIEVFHHTLMLSVGFAGALVVGRTVVAGATLERLAMVSMLAGAVYSFFNLMNFITGVLALTAVCAGLVLPANSTTRRRFNYMSITAAAWCFGYLGTWIGKWVFAAIATSPSAVWEDIRAQFAFRINGDHESISNDFGAGLRSNMDAWLDPPLTRVILAIIVITLLVSARRIISRGSAVLAISAAFAALPVVFILLTNNHSQIHFWFEYRSLALGLSAFLMACGWAWNLAPSHQDTSCTNEDQQTDSPGQLTGP